ncbi:MAG: universal stress protein [Thermomicrobia bacterium]|nr:universal stress protein [Thermomicrobia bacterium]
MFRHLLVPLDGSGLAETTLPVIRTLAYGSGERAQVTLLHLIERGAPASVHGARHLTTVPDAEAYLTAIAERFRAAGITVDTHVDTNESGDTAGRIVDHATEMMVDLVVLCAHGRSGLGRWLFGSIAQKVLAVGIAPVLMVLPTEGTEPRSPLLKQILLPLDGTPDAETALPLTANLARAMGGVMHLILVVPTVGTLSGAMSSIARFSPQVTTELLESAGSDAVVYLDAIASRLRAQEVAVETSIARGDPATAIVEQAKRVHADLIVMATHGRAGMGGAWAGSVSAKVLARSPGPFLLIRAPGEPQTIT